MYYLLRAEIKQRQLRFHTLEEVWQHRYYRFFYCAGHWPNRLHCFFLMKMLQGAPSAALLLPTQELPTLPLVSQKNLGQSDYRGYRLPEYPDHAVRMKEQTDDLCDAGSKQYTGWLDVGGRHLFFCRPPPWFNRR